jgi:glycosyltransferase involved in cell wall biosynthesis
MRILIAHNRYRFAGGEERHVELLERALTETGLEVRRYEVPSSDDPGLLERINLGIGLTYRPSSATHIRGVLRDWRPDVVHFHNVFPRLTPAAMREAKRHGAAVALTAHNYRFACPGGDLLRNGQIHDDCVEGSSLLCGLRNSRGVWSESVAYGLAIELQRRLGLLKRWVDAYIAPSEFIAKMLVRAGYPHERIHMIHHGVPTLEAPSAKDDFALYVGRLSPEKGVATLLAASRAAPEVNVVMLSTGPLVEQVRAAAADGAVSYLGYVSDSEVERLRQEARFTLVPSECYEGLPLGVVESFAAGTAAVGSDLGGIAEIIEDGRTGVLVAPGDAGALAEGMRRLWREPAKAGQMGAAALAFAKEKFDPARQAGRLKELFARLTKVSRNDSP